MVVWRRVRHSHLQMILLDLWFHSLGVEVRRRHPGGEPERLQVLTDGARMENVIQQEGGRCYG